MCNMSTCVTLCMWYVTSHLSRRNLWGFILHVTLCMWYVTNAICHGATCDMHSASSCSSLLHPLALTIPYHTGDILYVTFCVWYWSQIICVVLCHLYQTSDTRHLICDIVWYLTRASVGLQLCAIAIASFFSISFCHPTTSHPFSLSDNLKYPNPCPRSLWVINLSFFLSTSVGFNWPPGIQQSKRIRQRVMRVFGPGWPTNLIAPIRAKYLTIMPS